jgi:GNAT superfamily N-acetyltransferase
MTQARMSASDILPDDGITIRHFQPEDLEQVKILFQQGMLSLIPEMVKVLITLKLTSVTWNHPFVMTAPLLAVGWHASWSRTLPLYAGAVLTAQLAWLIFYYVKTRRDFQGYVQNSVDTDLSNISSVYQKDGGCFLVATVNERVVGIVGGEFKEEKDGKRVYELRRMSVDSQIRGRGIGKRLIRRLEKELDRLTTIFLTCSNLQPPAHVLYKGQNFQMQNISVPPGQSKAFVIFRFEKHY